MRIFHIIYIAISLQTLLLTLKAAQDFKWTIVGREVESTFSYGGTECTLAVMSARPDGASGGWLSLFLVISGHRKSPSCKLAKVMHEEATSIAGNHFPLSQGVPSLNPNQNQSLPIEFSVKIDKADIEGQPIELACFIHHKNGPTPKLKFAAWFNIQCQNFIWSARDEMAQRRLSVKLTMSVDSQQTSSPNAGQFDQVVGFQTEATDDIKGVDIAACLDPMSIKGPRTRDFDEWLVTNELAGIERMYIADQPYYYEVTQRHVDRGYLIRDHKLYTDNFLGNRPLIFDELFMIEDCFQTYCAHEHYKDKWIVSALDSDEFIAHKNTSRTEREGDHGYIPGLPANSLVDVLKRYETGTSRHSALCVTTSFNLWPFKEKPLRKIGWNEIGVGAKREDNWSRPDKLAIEHSIFMHKSKRYFAPKCIFRTKFLWGHLWQHGVYTNGSCPKRFYEIKKNKPRVNLCDSFNGRRKIPFFCKLFCSGALDHHIYPDELVLFHMRLGYGPPTGEFEPTLLNMAPDVRQRLQAMYKVDSIAKIPNHVATK